MPVHIRGESDLLQKEFELRESVQLVGSFPLLDSLGIEVQRARDQLLDVLETVFAFGAFGEEEQAIVVLVNEEQATRQTALSDGDRVEFMINMVGGC